MNEKIAALEQRIRELEVLVQQYAGTRNEVPRAVAPFESGTPTNNGSVSMQINGVTRKFATVS